MLRFLTSTCLLGSFCCGLATAQRAGSDSDSTTVGAWRDLCYQQFAQGPAGKETLQAWLEPLPDEDNLPGQLLPANTRFGEGWRFQGRMRVRTPQFQQAHLLLSLERPQRLTLHFFSGAAGVALSLSPGRESAWCAYRTDRGDDDRAENWRIVDSAESLTQRLELRFGAPIAVGYDQGRVWLRAAMWCWFQRNCRTRPIR